MPLDRRPDRPVPPFGEPTSGGQPPRPGGPQPGEDAASDRGWPGETRPYRPQPGDPGAYAARHNRTRPDGRSYRPPSGDAGASAPRPSYSPGAGRPRASAAAPREAEQTRSWPDNPEWPDDASGRREPGRPEPGRPEPGRPKRGARLGGNGPMRHAMVVAGGLGVVVVLAIALVALTVLRGSPNGSAAANVTRPSSTASPTAKAPTKAPAKASAKPTPSKTKTKAKPKPSAKPSTKPKTAGSEKPSSMLTVPAGWKLAFDPGFSGSQLDTSLWSTCYDWASSPSAGCTNNPSAEREWYIPSQVNVSGGTLNLVAKQESTPGLSASGAPTTYTCRSGMVTSKPGFDFTYGLIQITAKLPYGPGLWPALWLAATSDQWPPELDIMEHWYSEPQMKVYDHTIGKKYLGGAVPTPANLSAGFHTYSLLWTKDRVTWYLDGVQTFTTTSYVPQQAMYFIANVADDSTAPGACSGTMEIQSVKVWQP